jgi:lipid II:glycine glycyltransferase (peptidoglycan interpeptide bridge formation enzyme)
MDVRQFPKYAKYLEFSGWIVEECKIENVKCKIFIKRLPIFGSIIKIQRPEKIPFEKINNLAKKYHTFAVYIEPPSTNHQSLFIKHGFRSSSSPFLPTKTIHLDLTQSEGKILAQMAKDARYGIRKAKQEHIKILKVQDLEKFRQFWKKSIGWQRWVPSLKSLQLLKKAFAKNALFLLAPNLGGTIILTAGNAAYYYQAFTSKEGRKKFAQYLLVWEAIKKTKKQGCKIFDFEGIYDERFPNKSWKGFSHFKKSFGGKEVEYPGSFIKFYNPILKFISKLQIPI